MYAVIEAGGKQYKVAEGTRIRVELMPQEAGTEVTIDKVFVLGLESGAVIGTPLIDGASVTATVNGHGKEDKVIVFKYRRKKNYRRFRGHRQNYTELTIKAISGPGV